MQLAESQAFEARIMFLPFIIEIRLIISPSRIFFKVKLFVFCKKNKRLIKD